MSEWEKRCEDWDKIVDASDRLLKEKINEDNIFKSHLIQMLFTGKEVKAEGDEMQKRIEELEIINIELAIRYGSLIKKNIDVEKKLEAIQNIIESNRYYTVKLFMIEIAFKYDVWTVEEIKERWKGKCDE